jgi:hypothetical protein
MSYNALISKSLTQAFILLKDLAVPAVLERKAPASFDFASHSPSPDALLGQSSFKVIVLEKKKQREVEIWKLLFKMTPELEVLETYSHITIGAVRLSIGEVLLQKNHTVLLEASVSQ